MVILHYIIIISVNTFEKDVVIRILFILLCYYLSVIRYTRGRVLLTGGGQCALYDHKFFNIKYIILNSAHKLWLLVRRGVRARVRVLQTENLYSKENTFNDRRD